MAATHPFVDNRFTPSPPPRSCPIAPSHRFHTIPLSSSPLAASVRTSFTSFLPRLNQSLPKSRFLGFSSRQNPRKTAFASRVCAEADKTHGLGETAAMPPRTSDVPFRQQAAIALAKLLSQPGLITM